MPLSINGKGHHNDGFIIIPKDKPLLSYETPTKALQSEEFQISLEPGAIPCSGHAGHMEVSIQNQNLKNLEVEHNRMEQTLKRQAHDLQERIKEINCLYGISTIVEQNELCLETIFHKVIDLIPSSWQYPEITCAQLLINDESHRTSNYKNTFWKQQAEVVAYGKVLGVLTVCYLEKRPERDEGPFLKEERFLINAIAERLGRTCERKQAQKALGLSEQKLKEQNLLLKEKNIALREAMNQLITEKNNLEKKVMANVDNLLLPLLKKLENRASALEKEKLNLLDKKIEQLILSFGPQVSKKNPKLTPRENEICNMIRGGLSSKEVAKILNISYRSVETYRNYIRKKLGITNQKVNLASYLATL